MKIINNTERYTNLTTNRLTAVSTNFDLAEVDRVTVTGLIETLDFNANGTMNVNFLNANGTFNANDGIVSTSVGIPGNYNVTPSDSNKLKFVTNTTGAATTITLPDTAGLAVDTAIMLRFKMGTCTSNVNFAVTVGSADNIRGTIPDGAGSSISINNVTVTAQSGTVVEGDEINFVMYQGTNTWYVGGNTRNTGAFV